jgi:predicted Ser/Thr protein kinase
MTAPATIGRYEVIRELGRGAMGTVFLARDTALGRLVALKSFRLDLHTNGDLEDSGVLRRRTLREAQQAGALSHPNVVTIYDVVESTSESTFHIVMEYVEGEGLDARMREHGPMKLADVAPLVTQIAYALDHLHARGIVHRDVKPGNVLVAEDGRVKITDFGIARSEDPAATLDTQIYGTPYYMAPEQIQGQPPDGRSDVFALGVVVYEMLTGKRPFPGATVAEVAHQVVYSGPIEPEVDGQPLPKGVHDLLARALAKDPALRFASAGEFAQALQQVAQGSSDLERTPTRALPRRGWLVPPRSATQPWWSATRVAVVAALLALLLVAAGAAYLRWFRSSAESSTDGELQARQIGYVKLVSEGKRLLAEGDPQGAALVFQTAEELAIDPAAAHALGEAARLRAEEDGAHLQLLDARAALARGRYDEVVATARSMLETKAGREKAADVLGEVEDALARERQRPATPTFLSQRTATAPLSGQIATQQLPVVDYAVLHLDLQSSSPEGVLALWVDEREVARHHFEFYERTGWFRKLPVPGTWATDLKLSPGRHDLRLLVARKGEAAEVTRQPGTFVAGELRTLIVTLPGAGAPVVALR